MLTPMPATSELPELYRVEHISSRQTSIDEAVIFPKTSRIVDTYSSKLLKLSNCLHSIDILILRDRAHENEDVNVTQTSAELSTFSLLVDRKARQTAPPLSMLSSIGKAENAYGSYCFLLG